jgi:hypothetical protein
VLQSADIGDAPVELSVNGRRTTFPARDVVDFGRATAAITEFLRSGRPHPGLAWRIG